MNTHALRKLPHVLFVLGFALSVATAFADSAAAPGNRIVGQIDYRFVAHLEQTDAAERLLVWEGSITGDITGEMKWWFVNPSPVSGSTLVGGRVDFYVARWEIRAGRELLLAGESAGKTVFPAGADGIWDGHGVVTDAFGEYKAWQGRKIFETGPVVLGSEPPVSFSGIGLFLIY